MPSHNVLAIDPARFWARVDQTNPSGCWPWLGALNESGYGIVRVGGRTARAHRVAFELSTGRRIAHGMQIDHVRSRGCARRDCCNPGHLEEVTPAENSRRSKAGEVNRALMLSRTHCVRNHEFTPDNTHISPNGTRICRACKRLMAKSLYDSRKENLR